MRIPLTWGLLLVILTEKKCVVLIFIFVLTYEAVLKNVDYEVRAGLSSVYAEKGWVADDIHSEAGSRTLDYACKFFLLTFSA